MVPLLDGYRLVAFTAESSYLHIPGEGLTSLKDRSKRGKLIIKFQPVTDKKLGPKVRRKIEHMVEGKQTSDPERWIEEMHSWTLGSRASRFVRLSARRNLLRKCPFGRLSPGQMKKGA